MTRREWAPDMCFYCRQLEIRECGGGEVRYWCARRGVRVPEAYIWRRHCRGFVPMPQPCGVGVPGT